MTNHRTNIARTAEWALYMILSNKRQKVLTKTSAARMTDREVLQFVHSEDASLSDVKAE